VVRKPERKRRLGISENRNEDSIKMYVKEGECEDIDWIHLALDTFQLLDLVNTVMNLRVP